MRQYSHTVRTMPRTLLSLSCALLLTLHCCIPLTSCQNSNQIDLSSMTSVGTTEFKGSKLRVFELDGAQQVAEPMIRFAGSCSSLRYNRLYLRYQLSVPMHLDANTLARPTGSGKSVGHVTITDIDLQLDAALAGAQSKVTAMMKHGKSGSWSLKFLCDSFSRCQDLRDELLSHPWTLQQAVKFIPIGKVGNVPVRFPAVPSVNFPHLTDCSRGRWFVIQRRVDGNMSFAKNWDSYVKGFGNPNSNYWIGLESLFAITATKNIDKTWKSIPETSLCQMRIEADGLDGKKYWSQYGIFQVMGPDENYKLRVGQEVAGSAITSFIHQTNEKQFSTYDRDHDSRPEVSCSQSFGFGGWWYGQCHAANPNGPFNTRVTDAPYNYESLAAGDKWLQVKHTVMKLKCD